jgi:NADH-quinone oxidoreductase subunit L
MDMNADTVKSILWLVPAIPLIASILNAFISLTFLASKKKADLTPGQKFARGLTGIIGITAIISALTISIILMFWLNGYKEHRLEIPKLYTWIPSGDFQISFGLLLDPLTSVMMVVVNTISLLVHIFSTGYMKNEDGFHRFYTYLPFFTFSMLLLVMCNNFLWLYVGWELVGLSSYLLIGFWFAKKYDWGRMLPAQANVKAFVVNRIGDFGFGLGIMWLFVTMLPHGEGPGIFDRLNYEHVFEVFESGGVDGTVIFLISILLFMGAMGKSAQMPLHVWLPDAMAGPTPVSALIHAATMVTAGVYLVGRINPIIVRSEEAILVVAIIGIATAFFGSTVGCTQKDIKAVMAYSTVSQLGYMFFALGVFGWVAAFFHLMTHAFFKGLLFLGSGAIIHSNEETIKEKFEEIHHNAEAWAKKRYPDDPEKAKEYAFELFEAAENAIEYGVDPRSSDRLMRDGLDPQDMDYMGQYYKQMPVVAISMTFGAAALAGIPLTAGFWSKDEILGITFAQGYYWIFALGLFSALLTAFYSFRMIFSVFWSKSYRMPAALNRLAHAGMSKKAAELGIANFNPREIIEFVPDNADKNRNQSAVHIHKPGWNMQGPLVFLAFMSVAAGYVGLPNAIFGKGANIIDHFMEPTFEPALEVMEAQHLIPKEDFTKTLILLIVSGVVALTGVGIAYVMYHQRRDELPEKVGALSGPLYNISRNKWYFDEAYNLVFVKGGLALFRLIWRWFDVFVIDGIVNGIGRITRLFSMGLRKVQTGFFSNYALYIALGLVVVVAIFYFTVGVKF